MIVTLLVVVLVIVVMSSSLAGDDLLVGHASGELPRQRQCREHRPLRLNGASVVIPDSAGWPSMLGFILRRIATRLVHCRARIEGKREGDRGNFLFSWPDELTS